LDASALFIPTLLYVLDLNTLSVSARSIPTVTTFCPLSSFTKVVTDVDGDTAADAGGISSLLARSSIVEKLLNVDLSRFDDGDMLCALLSAPTMSKVRAGISP
jgi:hypothetical protein